jgi:hypothetical protein
LKSIAIYREGSKRSAPLNTRKTRDMGGTTEDVDVALDITIDREDFQKRFSGGTRTTTLRGKIDKPLSSHARHADVVDPSVRDCRP